MRRPIAMIISAIVLASGQTCLGVFLTEEQGLFFRFQGYYYGIYDSRNAELVSLETGQIVGGYYWSGVALGPLGRLGVDSYHPWFRETAPFVLATAGIFVAARAWQAARGRVRES